MHYDNLARIKLVGSKKLPFIIYAVSLKLNECNVLSVKADEFGLTIPAFYLTFQNKVLMHFRLSTNLHIIREFLR
jgi:hypothetical protein